MRRLARPPGPLAAGRVLTRACWVGLALGFVVGAGPPEVVRVRVPADKVSAWFPAGPSLHVLPSDQFEELLRSAVDHKPAPRAPRILRARHTARWESGMLSGRSEFEVDRAGSAGPGLLILDPWSPALTTKGDRATLARSTEDGRLGLKLAPDGPSSLAIDWQLRARPGTAGKAFALALPGSEISSMALGLPPGLIPEGGSGTWIGPESGPEDGLSTWRLPAASGRMTFRLRDRSEEGQSPWSPRHWLEGPTRIDLDAPAANWRADWTLEESPGAPRRLTVGLDPGMELVGIEGPKVASFRVEPGPAPSRVVIQLREGGPGPSPITILAMARAPAEGSWPIPSARPIDAVWTGGRTTVRLDPGRELQACLEKSGRRVPPRTAEAPTAPTLAFEPEGGAGPLAELIFRKPSADAMVLVRGHLQVNDDSPRIKVALTWTFVRGRFSTYSAELPPGWMPDRVISATGESVAWHAELLPGGGRRVWMSPPALEGEARSLTIQLMASLRGASASGPIDLPRVRPSPSCGRIVDEIWVATTAPGLALRPVSAEGLAWIDPPDANREPTPAPWGPEDLVGALAWRWVADRAGARAARDRVRDVPRGDVRLDAWIVKDRLQLDWTLAIDGLDRETTSIPILLSDPVGVPLRWKVAEPDGGTIEAQALDRARRPAQGMSGPDPALVIDLVSPRRGRLVLKAHVELPWGGKGRIPLLGLPGSFRTRGLVSIRVEDTARLRVDQAGLTPVDLSEVAVDGPEATDDPAGEGDPSHRRSLMFTYGGPGGRLGIETTPGDLSPTGGVIREALLTTQVHPGSGLRNRLTLRVAAEAARELVLAMPPDAAIDRIRRDGQAVSVTREGPSLRVPIFPTGPGRGLMKLVIDYRTGPPPSASIDPSSVLPACPLPCVSFIWEVIKPDPWMIRDPSPGLMDTDPTPVWSWAHALLGFRFDPWDHLARRESPDDRAAVLGEIEKVASGLPGGDVCLGDWFVKLDSGRIPLVIDRLALLSVGLGPASRLSLDFGSGQAPGIVEATLQAMGLVASPLDGVILVSTRSDSPDFSRETRSTVAAWSSTLGRASTTGSDESDRFQSASRWRGEPTPRALLAGESIDRFPREQGWRSRRFVATGWPSAGTSVTLVDERSEVVRGWLLASMILTLGIVARRRPARSRALGIGLTLAFASLAIVGDWPEPGSWATGAVRGLLAVLAFWLGHASRGDRRRPTSGTVEAAAASRSALGSRVAIPFVLLAMVGLRAIPTLAGPDEDPPILVLFPFEGKPDPSAKPDRAVMLLDDYERLRRLARHDPPPTASRALLTASTYRVSREEPGFATVEGRFEVEVEGTGPASWSIPVGASRDLSATVDGRPSPLGFAKDGRTATLSVNGPGVHPIRVRSLVPMAAAGPGGDQFRLPIVRSAFAAVEVARDVRGHWVELPEAAGPVELREGEIRGTIGPVDALEVRWFATGRPRRGGPKGPVEATMLWDALPMGDLLRVRLSHSDPEGASTLRLAMEPGLLVRRLSVPDLFGDRKEGSVERPEWVAQIEPPWSRDVPIEIEFWRPRVPGLSSRRLPRVEILDAGRFSAVVGFRRPGDWSGRLESGPGLDPIPDASFARAWGTLPGDGLTLAGAVRVGPSKDLGVVTGPPPRRSVVRPTVLVEVEPGRLKATIEARLSDRRGHSFEVEIEIPPDFRVVRVESAGLVDWQRVDRGRIRIEFDGSEAPDRVIQVQGYLPVPAETALAEASGYRASIPWPRWPDSLEEPGTLIVPTQARFEAGPGEGASPISPAGTVESGPAARMSYRVEDPARLGRLLWSSPRSKVGVSVRSDLTIDPSHVTWTAVVDSDVTGGPAESFLWNLPTEWARAAELEIDGRPIRPSTDVRGEVTSWKIQPDSAIWRRSRLVIRSRIPLRTGVPFSFPEISPMAVAGRGSVVRYDLALANVSGRPMEVAGTAGLQAIDASRHRSDESPAPPGSIGRAYRVTGERWALKITIGDPPGSNDADHPEIAKVARARLRGSLDASGEVIGLAAYDLKPHPGAYLALNLPASADVPWGAVDGSPAPVIRDGPGRWRVVLRDRNARRVDVAWSIGPDSKPRTPPSGLIDWPSTDRADVPTLVRWSAPRAIEVSRPGTGWKPVPDHEWEVEEAEQLARQIADVLPDFQRGSRRQRGEVLKDLVDFELKERSITRSGDTPRSPSEPDQVRLQAAREAIAEACQMAGLEELVQEARAIVGVGSAPSDLTAEDRADTAEPVRIRRIGASYGFRSEAVGTVKSPAIAWTSKATRPGWRSPWSWMIGAIGLGIASGSALLVARPIRAPRASVLVALLAVGLILLGLEPLGTGLAIAIAGLGRLLD